MSQLYHIAIITSLHTNKKYLIKELLIGEKYKQFSFFKSLKYGICSKSEVDKFVDLEERLELKKVTFGEQPLKTMSSGEQKKALLNHLLNKKLECLILDDPLDSLDVNSQRIVTEKITQASNKLSIIQLVSRTEDILPFINKIYKIEKNQLIENNNRSSIKYSFENMLLPKAKRNYTYNSKELVRFKDVSVSFNKKPILQNINWTINQGEFWQLIGPNGSGKSTLIGMVTGDNPKGYGADLYLFGKKKGTGETIWSIKEKIGYFSPAQIYNFKGHHTVLHMVISGFNDSVGLYIKPNEIEQQLAKEWLQLINLWHKKETNFSELSMGEQRLVMCARAMVKHPLLLILDEPTVGLDDASAAVFVTLINKIAQEEHTSILFVSHRNEEGLEPNRKFILEASENGSVGKILE